MASSAVSRRHFLETSAAAGAALATARAAGNSSGSKTIRIGIIGCNGMGRGNLDNCARHPDVAVAAVCDVWQARRKAVLEKFPQAKEYADYRDLLADKNVDAVIVATPPHWHALVAIHAAQAGKDIYLQKPMTLHLGESLAVKNAVKRHEVVCQIGTQIHAGENYRRVVEKVRAGHIGQVSGVRTFNDEPGPAGIGKNPDTTVPALTGRCSVPGRNALQPCWRPTPTTIALSCVQRRLTPGMRSHSRPAGLLDLGYPMVACSGAVTSSTTMATP